MDGGNNTTTDTHYGNGINGTTPGGGPVDGSPFSGVSVVAEKDPTNNAAAVNDPIHHGDVSKRTYSVTACELCKARKVKCDRAEPSCSWCSRHGRICVYKGRQKPGFRAGSVRDLEHKVDRLEAMLQILGHRVEDHVQFHDSGGRGSVDLPRPAAALPPLPPPLPPPPQFPPQILPDQSHDVAKSYDDHNRRYTMSLVGSPGVPRQGQSDPQTYEKMQYDRTSETMSIQSMTTAQTVLGDMSEHQRSPSMSGPTPTGMAYHRHSVSDFDLPPYDLLYALVDLYFKHVNTWCPILDRKITFDTFFNSPVLDEPDRIVLHAIVATSLRFYEDSGLAPEARERFHNVANQKVLLYGIQNPTVKALQALVILAFDFFGVSDGPQSWNILAMLVGNVRRLRLNTENSISLKSNSPAPYLSSVGTFQEFVLPPSTSWVEEEGRRRLFWMVYTLDRYVAVGSASNFLLGETESCRALPCRYDLFSKNHAVETRWFDGPGRSELLVNRPENLGSFSHHCDVLRTMSRVQIFLRQPVDICSLSEVQQWQATYRELDGELNSWLYDLPDEYNRVSQLCHSDPTSKISNWIMIHAAFVTAVLRLHSCAAYPTVRSHIFTPSYIAMQRCLAAVQSLREIAQDVVNTGMLSLLGPHFAFSLWVSARLLLVHAASTGNEVDPKIQFFILTLEQMGPYWPVARRYAQLLDRVIKAATETPSPHLRPPPPPPPSSSSAPPTQSSPTTLVIAPKALAAMRRSAYDIYLVLSQRPSTTTTSTTTPTPTSTSPSTSTSTSTSKPTPPSATTTTTATKQVSAHELEYFEIFDFFNCPRLPADLLNTPPNIHNSLRNVDSPSATSTSASTSSSSSYHHLMSGNFGMARAESDWLSFGRSG